MFKEFKDMFIVAGGPDWPAIIIAPIKIVAFLFGFVWAHVWDALESGERSI